MTSNNNQHTSEFPNCPPDIIQIELDPLINQNSPAINLPPDPEMVAKGWERRFMADPNRLEESVNLYRELGYEIQINPVRPEELSVVCGDCRLAVCSAYSTIYTRKQSKE